MRTVKLVLFQKLVTCRLTGFSGGLLMDLIVLFLGKWKHLYSWRLNSTMKYNHHGLPREEGASAEREDVLSRKQSAKMLAEGYVYISALRPFISILRGPATPQQWVHVAIQEADRDWRPEPNTHIHLRQVSRASSTTHLLELDRVPKIPISWRQPRLRGRWRAKGVYKIIIQFLFAVVSKS